MYLYLKLYLRNRTQLTSIEGELSKETTVTYRVPQGSLLGSLLFLIYIIYINDLGEAISDSLIHNFANDTMS